jgi:3-oxoacyl-[acyl-carrier protein] reductase
VVNYSTSKSAADSVVHDTAATGGNAVAVGGDVSIESDVARLFETVREGFGHLDVLVNNAGVYEFAPLEAVTHEMYTRLFDTKVIGLLLATKAAVALFPDTGGSIINVDSVASALAPPQASVYAASKSAVDVITPRQLRQPGPRRHRGL